MRVRYIISEKWESYDIHEIIDAVRFAVKFFDIYDAKSTLTVKLINGTEEPFEATAFRIKNKRYEIRLSRTNIEDTLDAVLIALFHELTHVKQFVKDGFQLIEGKAYWKTKKIKLQTNMEFKAEIMQSEIDFPIELKNKDKITLGDLYWFSPWEMEARAMERVLVHLYEQDRD